MEFLLSNYKNICPPPQKKLKFKTIFVFFSDLQNLGRGVFGVSWEVKEGNRFHKNNDLQGSVLLFVTTFFFFFLNWHSDADMHS